MTSVVTEKARVAEAPTGTLETAQALSGQHLRRAQFLGYVTAIPVLITSILVMASWWGGPEQLRSLASGLPTMKFNTALGLAGVSGAILVQARHPASAWARGLLSAVLVLATLTLVEYAFAIDLGIDQLFALDTAAADGPGRMSAATAVCFTLVSLPTAARLPLRFSQIIVLAGLSLAVLPLAVYLYDPASVRAVAPFESMAVHTAAAFVLCFAGATIVSPGGGGRRVVLSSPGGALLRRTLLALAIAPLAAGALGALGRSHGLFPSSFGLAFGATASSVVVIALVYWAAGQFDDRASQLELQTRAAVEAGDQLKAVLDITADAIIQVDRRGRILTANQGVERMFGYPRAELLGASVDSLIPMNSRGSHREHLERFASGPDGSRMNVGPQMRGVRKDGEEIRVETTVVKHTIAGEVQLSVSLRDRSDEVRKEAALREEALTDALTQTGNRRAFDLTAEWVFARGGSPAVIIADIDRFKQINDRWGHLAGDAVLRQFAGTCGNVLRTEDRLFRYGGEEFALVMAKGEMSDAVHLAERLRERIERTSFELPDGSTINLTCSLGVSRRSAGEGVAAVVARADAALYAAKEAGRNRVTQSNG